MKRSASLCAQVDRNQRLTGTRPEAVSYSCAVVFNGTHLMTRPLAWTSPYGRGSAHAYMATLRSIGVRWQQRRQQFLTKSSWRCCASHHLLTGSIRTIPVTHVRVVTPTRTTSAMTAMLAAITMSLQRRPNSPAVTPIRAGLAEFHGSSQRLVAR